MKTFLGISTALAFQVQAIVPPVSSPTDSTLNAVYDYANGFSPKPTTAPSELKLRKRQNVDVQNVLYVGVDNTCGYVSGSTSERVTCAIGDTCAAYYASTMDFNVMGCCDDRGCRFPTTCYDYAGIYTSSLCGTACQSRSDVAACTKLSEPYCQRQVVPGMSMALLMCKSVSPLNTRIIRTTYDGQPAAGAWATLDAAEASATFGVIELPPLKLVSTSIVTTITSTTSSSSTTSSFSPTQSSSPAPVPKSTPVGAIVGGAIGGLAIVAGIIGLVVFFLLRRKREQSPRVPTEHGMVEYQSQPPYNPPELRNSAARSCFAPSPGGTASLTKAYDAKVAPVSPIAPIATVYENPGSGPSSPSPAPQEQYSPPPPFATTFNNGPPPSANYNSAPPLVGQVYYPPPVERAVNATPTAELGVSPQLPRGKDGRGLYEAA